MENQQEIGSEIDRAPIKLCQPGTNNYGPLFPHLSSYAVAAADDTCFPLNHARWSNIVSQSDLKYTTAFQGHTDVDWRKHEKVILLSHKVIIINIPEFCFRLNSLKHIKTGKMCNKVIICCYWTKKYYVLEQNNNTELFNYLPSTVNPKHYESLIQLNTA